MSIYIDTQKVGRNALNYAFTIKALFGLAADVTRNSRALLNLSVRKVFFKQIYFTGVQALLPVSVIGVMIGMVIITQVASIAGPNPLLIGKVLVWTVVRELGPLLAAIIITARSSTAVAAELGSMKINKELDSLKIMGIEPLRYLIVPRVFGSAISVVVLTFYFQAMSLAGGMLIFSAVTDISFYNQMMGIFSVLGLFDIVVSLLKSLVFGFIISTSSCFNGLRVKSSITEVPQVTSAAVMQSLSLIFVFDGVITLASYI